MSEKHQCEGRVWHADGGQVRGWGRSCRCSRNGVVEEGGKWYCKQHVPSVATARRDAAFEKRQAEWRAEMAAKHRAAACATYCAGVDPLPSGTLAELLDTLRLYEALHPERKGAENELPDMRS